jgi:DMSO/TMAO reductase YedYZ molybdopterin-dependent catalytic subunit
MRPAVTALSFAAFAFSAAAQDASTVTVSGQVQHPLTLTLSDLQKMPAVDVVIVLARTETDVSLGKFRGVSLWTVLDKAGLANGPEKNAYLRHTILVTGSDGYATAFSEG